MPARTEPLFFESLPQALQARLSAAGITDAASLRAALERIEFRSTTSN